MKVTKNYGSYLFALAKLESLKWAKQEGERWNHNWTKS